MKCPFCGSQGLIGFTVGGPYITGEGKIDSSTMPKKLKFSCNNCKREIDPTDLVLKVLYNHIGEMNQAVQLECVEIVTISNESGLPIDPEVREALSVLKGRKQVDILQQGEVDKPGVTNIYAKITDAGKNIVEQYKS